VDNELPIHCVFASFHCQPILHSGFSAQTAQVSSRESGEGPQALGAVPVMQTPPVAQTVRALEGLETPEAIPAVVVMAPERVGDPVSNDRAVSSASIPSRARDEGRGHETGPRRPACQKQANAIR
jgi:hypothetical protein